ncbi:MAG: mono/diheme cytochrome c family protein [Woeseiaceae bacterium]|jgi:mono/diheme cytochrome c family protein
MRIFLPVLIILTLVACAKPATTVAGRWYTEEQVVAGAPLYQTYCAVCHAADGSATAEWKTPGADGNYPPPPLNGTAHTWHHPLELLDYTIVNGGVEYGGVMPGFGEALDEAQRLAIVAWFQSLWTDDIYDKWLEIDQRNAE